MVSGLMSSAMQMQRPGGMQLRQQPGRGRPVSRSTFQTRARAASPTRQPPAPRVQGKRRAAFTSGIPLQRLWATRRQEAGPASKHRPESAEDTSLDFATNLEAAYRVGKVVGHGAFGTIRLARSRSTGETVAIKVLSKSRPGQSRQRTAGKLKREADCMAAVMECQGVVGLRGLFEDKSAAYLVMDHCSGGDLEQLVQKGGKLGEYQAAVVLFEVLQVVAACHRRGVCHGDIKPANFLMRRKPANAVHSLAHGERPDEPGWLKAIDFGCAQQVMCDKPLSRRTGTPVYMAPEVFVRNYNRSADMWSVGILLYHLLSARFPFWEDMASCKASSLEEVMEAVTKGAIDYTPLDHLSPEGRELLDKLLVRDPAQRITAEAALQDEWFKLHLGWEADAPRLLQHVLPQLVTTWANEAPTAPSTAPAATVMGSSAAHPEAKPASIAQPPLPQQPVVAEPVMAAAAPAGSSRGGSRKPVKKVASARRMVANNVLPVEHHKRGASAASGKASKAKPEAASARTHAAAAGCEEQRTDLQTCYSAC